MGRYCPISARPCGRVFQSVSSKLMPKENWLKIALISPPIPRRYVRGADEPLSIEYLAAQVRDEHEVRLIDAFGRNLSAAQTLEELSCFSPDIIGVSLVFGGAWNPTLQICREAKGKWPRAVTILGGNTATFMVKELLA